jgi:type I restriction enzyme, S subunit
MNEVVAPSGWEVKRLGDVSNIVMGQSPSSSTYNAERDGLPFLQGKADFGNHYPTIKTWCSEPTKIASRDAILFSVRAPVGDVNVSTTECCIGRGLASITGTSSDQNYLYQQIQFIKPQFQLIAQGSTFEAINGSDLKDFPVPLPPLPEQEKIASILISVDEVIEKTQSQINKLKDLKKAMMQGLLTKGIGHAEFKDSPVGPIPVGWKSLSLSEVSGLITKGSTPTTYGFPYVTEYEENKIVFLRAYNASIDGVCKDDSVKYISKEAHEYLSRSTLESGDCVITIVGNTVGTSFVVKETMLPANINQNVALIRPIGKKIRTDFLSLLIQCVIYKQIVKELAVQAQPSLSLKQVGEFVIPLPQIEEQEQISSILTTVDTNIDAKQRKLQQVQDLKKALMQDLLTGKVRVEV